MPAALTFEWGARASSCGLSAPARHGAGLPEPPSREVFVWTFWRMCHLRSLERSPGRRAGRAGCHLPSRRHAGSAPRALQVPSIAMCSRCAIARACLQHTRPSVSHLLSNPRGLSTERRVRARSHGAPSAACPPPLPRPEPPRAESWQDDSGAVSAPGGGRFVYHQLRVTCKAVWGHTWPSGDMQPRPWPSSSELPPSVFAFGVIAGKGRRRVERYSVSFSFT